MTRHLRFIFILGLASAVWGSGFATPAFALTRTIGVAPCDAVSDPIQDCIDNWVSDGDTINIPAGTYFELLTFDDGIELTRYCQLNELQTKWEEIVVS